MSVAEFLRDYWQIKPCLIRQAFPDFEPDLDENDVAGLACEELVEARLVTGTFQQADWAVRQGPFDEQQLAALPDQDWCLLVQDVEKHYPPLQALLAQFGFLPNWRLDDLMISVSAPGGSVGPHVDQYDVFLLQASGQRQWQIAHEFNPALLPGSELKVLREFTAEQEWTLQPGDMLYLPPGVAHYGLALELGMTWSIGLRAPSQADLFLAMGDWLAEHHAEGKRFADPDLQPSHRSGEISAQALQQFGHLLTITGSVEETRIPDFDGFLAGFMSRYRLAHQPAPPAQPLAWLHVQQQLGSGAYLQRNPWTRMNWLAQGTAARLFAAGDEFSCSPQLAETLCNPTGIQIAPASLSARDQDCILQLLNQGHLYLHHPDEDAK